MRDAGKYIEVLAKREALRDPLTDPEVDEDAPSGVLKRFESACVCPNPSRFSLIYLFSLLYYNLDIKYSLESLQLILVVNSENLLLVKSLKICSLVAVLAQELMETNL